MSLYGTFCGDSRLETLLFLFLFSVFTCTHTTSIRKDQELAAGLWEGMEHIGSFWAGVNINTHSPRR